MLILYLLIQHIYFIFFFFFNDTATTEIYTLSLHDALPISLPEPFARQQLTEDMLTDRTPEAHRAVLERFRDRKSTRLNSSHSQISYAVFCLKKKKIKKLKHIIIIALTQYFKYH